MGDMKNNHIGQTARIIQWLGDERGGKHLKEFFDVSSIEYNEQIQIKSKEQTNIDCIELPRLKSSNKQASTIFKRSSLFRRSSSLSRLSPDGQTLDEAYFTLSSDRSKIKNDLIRKESTSVGSNSSLSITPPIHQSLSFDDIYETLDCVQNSSKMNKNMLINDNNETKHNLLPILNGSDDRTMELFRNIMMNGDNGERDFKDMVDEFVQLIEKKLSDTELKMFDTNTTRSSSPSLFDMLTDLKTCLTLLRRTEIQSLLNVFDNVLKMQYYPSALPEHEDISINKINHANIQQNTDLSTLKKYGIDEFKVVKIEKTREPLGLTISRTDFGHIRIARIVVGGTAEATKLFEINDRILEINDQPITGQSLDDVCKILSNTNGLIKFLLSPPSNLNYVSYQAFYVRTLFSYDPRNDPLIPCKQLGLKFNRGDILRIVARDEKFTKMDNSYVSWWQAYRENSIESDTDPYLAGLVPSDSLQQKRTNISKEVSDDSESIQSTTTLSSSSILTMKCKNKVDKTCFTCGHTKKERKSLQNIFNHINNKKNQTLVIDNMNEKEIPTIRTSTNHFSLKDTRYFDEEQYTKTMTRSDEKVDDMKVDSFLFYEPVFRLDLLKEQITRPIVLLGASNVGRHELRRRLLQSEPNLFDVAIPHTTRARRLNEIPDIDYHFVSEAEFLAKVACHAFIEFGQYDRDLYGTSVDDIRYIVEMKRKICILNLNPDAIRAFNKTNLYPYIICIAAPSFERLKRLELDRRESLTDKDYREIIRQSRTIERHHRLLFDHILINNDLNRTYNDLYDLIIRIQHDNQQWVRTSYRQT